MTTTNDDAVRFHCVYCDETHVSDDPFDTPDGQVCETGFDADWRVCCGCDRTVRAEYCIYAEDDLWCEPCHDRRFTSCESCGEYVRYNNVYGRGDSTYCLPCAEDYDNEYAARDCVHSYGYKPSPLFFDWRFDDLFSSYSPTPKAIYMGFELEMEANDPQYVADELADHAYLKDDGSLHTRYAREAFEVVTHPHTLEAYRNGFPWDWMEQARKDGARAWNNSSCGLHIHVNKDAIADRSHFARWWILLHRNVDEWVRFAGRTSTYASWEEGLYNSVGRRAAHEYPFEMKYEHIDYSNWTHAEIRAAEQRDEARRVAAYDRNRFMFNTANQGGRYVALNCHNHATFELRFFRPSMKATTVLASLESVHASIEYTRSLRVIKDKGGLETKRELLTWDSFRQWVRANSDKYPYLDARIDVRFGTNPDCDDSQS